MFRFYVIPDATKLNTHSAIYSASNMKLFWDPRSESDSYAIIGAKGKAEINKAGSLEFSILPTNVCYNDFQKRKSVVLAYDDDNLIFEGFVSAKPRDFYKQRKITCTGALAYLLDSVQAPDEINQVVTPSATSGNQYLKVPLTWYDGANPNKLKWYGRSKNSSGKFVYERSNDTTANPDKIYYYKTTSNGENVSGTTITKTAATSEKLHEHIARILDVHNSQVDPYKRIFQGAITKDDSENHDFTSTGWRTSWDALNSDILESYGRYVTITTENGVLSLNYMNIEQMSDARPVIEYARNMVEMTENDSSDDIFTVLVPIGKDNLTVSGVTGHDSGGNKEIDPYIVSWGGAKRYVVVSKAAVARYGYIVKTQSFSSIESATELYDKAVKYIKNNYDYHTEYDVKAVDLKVLGESDHRISVGDKCRIKSTWHEVDERDLYVISAEYDYMNPENDSFKLGVPTSDKEAGNRRISSQTKNNSNSSKKNASDHASSSSHTSSILENYIHVTEWGLEMSSNLKNEVESNDKKYKTRFVQIENQLNISAEKLFGVDKEGAGDIDAGYSIVPKSEYRIGEGPYRNPTEENWFEKKNGKYVLSTDTTCDPDIVGDKTYYTQKLWSRYSDFQVGDGGIRAMVQGNYERSTASATWLDANERNILAVTGAIYVNEDGEVIIKSGSGFKTGHTEEKQDTGRFVEWPASSYSGSPRSQGLYEMKYNAAGEWLGAGKADSTTNPAYYQLTADTTFNRSKKYYRFNNTTETYHADFGIYDENNLTAGIMIGAINNPEYRPISDSTIKQAAKDASFNPSLNGWFERDASNGEFALTMDTRANRSKRYYLKENHYDGQYSYIRGKRIVLGYDDGYEGLDAPTQAKVNKYLHDHNLDGTITEIASDVVVVNALFARFIDWDDARGDTLHAGYGRFNYLYANKELEVYDPSDEDNTIRIAEGVVTALSLEADLVWAIDEMNFCGTTFVSEESASEKNIPSDIIMGFGTITTSGDTVNIPYRTAGMDDFDNEHILSFDKPASLGTVTWSSGNNGGTLTVKTVGGKTFLNGTIAPYVPNGPAEQQAMNNASYLETATTGYDQVYGLYFTNASNVASKTMLFKTPKDRYSTGYNDAISTVRTRSSSGSGDGDDISLGINGASTVYAQYKAYGQSSYTSLTGIKTHAPNVRSYGKYGKSEYGDGDTIVLEYDDSVTIYTQYHRYSDAEGQWTNYKRITVKSKPDNSSSIDKDDIIVGNFGIAKSDSEADYTFTTIASTVASADGNFLTFDVTIGDITKHYAIDLTS